MPKFTRFFLDGASLRRRSHNFKKGTKRKPQKKIKKGTLVLDHNGTLKHKNICFIFTNELVTTFHCQIVHKRVFTKKGDLNPQKGSLGDPGTQLAAVLIVSTA